MKEYKIDVLTIVQDQAIRSDCGDITFINRGITAATINASINLSTNQSISLSGNYNEIDRTIYTVKFAGGTGRLIVFRKVYI